MEVGVCGYGTASKRKGIWCLHGKHRAWMCMKYTGLCLILHGQYEVLSS